MSVVCVFLKSRSSYPNRFNFISLFVHFISRHYVTLSIKLQAANHPGPLSFRSAFRSPGPAVSRVAVASVPAATILRVLSRASTFPLFPLSLLRLLLLLLSLTLSRERWPALLTRASSHSRPRSCLPFTVPSRQSLLALPLFRPCVAIAAVAI